MNFIFLHTYVRASSRLSCHECIYACLAFVCKIYRNINGNLWSLKTNFLIFSGKYTTTPWLFKVTHMCRRHWLCSFACSWHCAVKNVAGMCACVFDVMNVFHDLFIEVSLTAMLPWLQLLLQRVYPLEGLETNHLLMMTSLFALR